jgi:hypothetical protein
MSLQKEKGLAPQKKNLKPKRESEAPVVKTPDQTTLFVGTEVPTSNGTEPRQSPLIRTILAHVLS